MKAQTKNNRIFIEVSAYHKAENKAILLGKIVNYVIAILGAIFCIYGVYIQVINNL